MLRSQRVPVVMPSELINVKHPFYTSPSVHREMLDDDVRTEAFRDALREVVAQYKDATVLDIGTGTGVLAIFAAQAGAKNVYGTETEGLLFDVTLQTLKRNNLDTAVQLVKYADGQKLKLPEQVDIIVSECLGHYGFDENMITAVSKCREYLKPGGTFVPSSLSLYTALVSAPDIYNDCIATWKNPRYGIDFYAVKDLALQKVYIKTFKV